MTKRREPLTYHAALTVIAARIGWDRCAAICGVTDRAVRYWSDPDCESEIRLLDAERLDRAFLADGGDHGPFQRLLTLRIEMAGREGRDDLVTLAADVAKEAGEAVSAALTVALVDDAAARRTAKREVHEAIDKLTDLAANLEGREQ